jgi:hypothetical protein
MLERLRQQLLRHFGPVVPYKPPCLIYTTHLARAAVKVHRADGNCSNDAVAQIAVQFAFPPAEREPQMDISEYRSQLDECLANAERTDNPQHKNTWLRLAECYRV